MRRAEQGERVPDALFEDLVGELRVGQRPRVVEVGVLSAQSSY
jgi:hypothetical protein